MSRRARRRSTSASAMRPSLTSASSRTRHSGRSSPSSRPPVSLSVTPQTTARRCGDPAHDARPRAVVEDRRRLGTQLLGVGPPRPAPHSRWALSRAASWAPGTPIQGAVPGLCACREESFCGEFRAGVDVDLQQPPFAGVHKSLRLARRNHHGVVGTYLTLPLTSSSVASPPGRSAVAEGRWSDSPRSLGVLGKEGGRNTAVVGCR